MLTMTDVQPSDPTEAPLADATGVAPEVREAGPTDVAKEKHPQEKEQVVGDATESEEETPTRLLTRNRAHLLPVQDSDTESDKTTRRRTRRQDAKKESANTSTGKQKKTAGKGKRSGKNASDEDDDGTPGEYIPVEVGDCVLLDSGDPDDHYVALVSSVHRSQNQDKQPGTFTAQWYYKPDDVREQVRALIDGGVLEGEVFLSPHKDKNSIDAVIGLCNVVSPEEYEEVQREIKRGFREKSKPYYICRFKYYPGRPIKKALEVVKNDAIRSGLGPMKPKIGDEFQVAVPEFTEPASRRSSDIDAESEVPWKTLELGRPSFRYRQMWSPLVLEHQSLAFRQFRDLLEPIRFAIGNVLKIFRKESKATGHLRCIVLKYIPSDHIQVCLSTGQVRAVLTGELCSPLGDDVAFSHFYRSRFNLCEAVRQCSEVIQRVQHDERDAFRKEVVVFSQLAHQDELELVSAAAIEAAGLDLTEEEVDDDDNTANPKRRK